MNEALQATLADAVQYLRGEGIDYALIGGLAASLRGQPRATADVDMVVAADVERAIKQLRSITTSQFLPLFEGAEQVVEQAFILPLRHTDTGVKVDMALALSGFEQQTIERAELVPLAGQSVAVATSEDIILMKLLAGRPQDDLDVMGIVVAQRDQLDWVIHPHLVMPPRIHARPRRPNPPRVAAVLDAFRSRR